MHAARFALVAALGMLVACGGGGSMDAGDAQTDGPDVPPRTDLLNLNCTMAGGDLPASMCNQMLMSMPGGATFFVGGRSTCTPDPNNSACVPLCPLTDMNPMNCTFDSTSGPGCHYNMHEGYVVVVDVGGRRTTTAVGDSNVCSPGPNGSRAWARVNFNDLTAAVTCAMSTPPGGFPPPTWVECTDVGSPCGPAGGGGMCQTITFMTMTGMFDVNLCTKMCAQDSDCGPGGSCQQMLCTDYCGGNCARGCPSGFQCALNASGFEGGCQPVPR